MRYIIILGIFALVLVGCATVDQAPMTSSEKKESVVVPDNAGQMRVDTYNQCYDLVNQTVDFKGTVVFEQCDKNCLGGCPSMGELFCYYAIEDADGCLLYVQSETYNYMPSDESLREKHNDFNIGEEVTVSDTVNLYFGPYCYDTPCPYLVLGDYN